MKTRFPSSYDAPSATNSQSTRSASSVASKTFAKLVCLFRCSNFITRTNQSFPGNSNLSEQCPICAHSPLSPAKPLKSLRLTILAFVKNIEKKREKERLSAISAETPAAPVTPIAPPTPAVASTPPVAEARSDQHEMVNAIDGGTAIEGDANVVESVEQHADAAEPSAEQDVGLPSTSPKHVLMPVRPLTQTRTMKKTMMKHNRRHPTKPRFSRVRSSLRLNNRLWHWHSRMKVPSRTKPRMGGATCTISRALGSITVV